MMKPCNSLATRAIAPHPDQPCDRSPAHPPARPARHADRAAPRLRISARRATGSARFSGGDDVALAFTVENQNKGLVSAQMTAHGESDDGLLLGETTLEVTLAEEKAVDATAHASAPFQWSRSAGTNSSPSSPTRGCASYQLPEKKSKNSWQQMSCNNLILAN